MTNRDLILKKGDKLNLDGLYKLHGYHYVDWSVVLNCR